MKKKKWITAAIAALLLVCMLPLAALADDGPYITWTEGPGGWIVDTQTAYLPDRIMDLGLNAPEDFYMDADNTLYVCDTGNQRIVIVEADGTVREHTDEVLSKPTGIHVAGGHIYVADYDLKEILIYTMDFQLENRIGRPTEAIFGENTKFMPKKLITDARGNLYVVSEGSTAGLMQFNPSGEFLGYFGSNATNTTLKMILQRTFFTQEQMNRLFKNAPPSVTNVGIDQQGLIYTITSGKVDVPVKKLSISGLNLYGDMFTSGSYIDVDVDVNGNAYTVTADGTIFEYDSYGKLLFGFGGKDNDKERVGIIKEASAIEIAQDGQLYVLDKGQNCVIVYYATEFAKQVHEGIAMYKDGRYAESEAIWANIRKMNSNFTMAYDALAKADYKKQNYDAALYNYKIAENKEGYSQTYWVYRNEWLQKNLAGAVLILIAVIILWKLMKLADKKRHILAPLHRLKGRILHMKLVSQVFFAKKFLKKPADAYYEMKFKGKASVASATVLYVWLFILQLTDMYVVSYLFNTTVWWNVSMFKEILSVAAPAALVIICNYLVSTISDGEGRLKDLYCGTIYALTPYLIFALPLQILTHALTLNEGFIYEFGMFFIMAWCVVLFVIMIKEVHAYSLSKTFKNIAVTAFTIALFLLAGFIIYLLFGQLKDFIISMMQEVAARG